MALREEPGFDRLVERLAEFNDDATPSFGPLTDSPIDFLAQVSKSGSNSMVVSADRSATGGALIANDPHVGLIQPPLWCLVGYQSPSGTVIGMTIAGLPMVLLGRNEWIAWGGTNMRGISSSFYDVRHLDPETFTDRVEDIGVRFWFDREAVVRDTEFGPLISDAPLFADLELEPTALRWRGHEPSDEISAALAASRARNWNEFRRAFATWAVSGQNFLYADVEGNVGQLAAIEFIPGAGRGAATLISDPTDPRMGWEQRIPSPELPAAYNPEAGFLVSANNAPFRSDPPLAPDGNANDRTDRMQDVLAANPAVSVADLEALQRDVFSASGLGAARALVSRLERVAVDDRCSDLLTELANWDGHYRRDSPGALAYQLLLAALLEHDYAKRFGAGIAGYLANAPAVHVLIEEDAEHGQISDEALLAAARSAARDFDPAMGWGDLHRVRVAHPFAFAPLIGSYYEYADLPADGSTTTIYKTAHSITDEVHGSFYGANARHISDLSDADANWFVLFGGQDGWLGSEGFGDQVPLWERGEFVQIPMRPAAVRDAFRTRMVMEVDGTR